MRLLINRKLSTFVRPSKAPTSVPTPSLRSFQLSQIRRQSQFPYRPRQRPQYNRFGRAENLKALWSTSPAFRYGVGTIGVGGASFYVYNLETVPVSGRRRFNCISAEREQEMSGQIYRQVMQEFGPKVLPAWHTYSRLVNKVMNRLIPASGLGNQSWEVHVIDDKQVSRMNLLVFSS